MRLHALTPARRDFDCLDAVETRPRSLAEYEDVLALNLGEDVSQLLARSVDSLTDFELAQFGPTYEDALVTFLELSNERYRRRCLAADARALRHSTVARAWMASNVSRPRGRSRASGGARRGRTRGSRRGGRAGPSDGSGSSEPPGEVAGRLDDQLRIRKVLAGSLGSCSRTGPAWVRCATSCCPPLRELSTLRRAEPFSAERPRTSEQSSSRPRTTRPRVA